MLLNYCSFIFKFANFRNGHVSTILQYFLEFLRTFVFSLLFLLRIINDPKLQTRGEEEGKRTANVC